MVAIVDRLNERSLIDRWGFMLTAFVGSALIVAAKYFNVASVIVALFACSAIVIYALAVNNSGTGKLRGDQAGDNCYYLGLIYTLVSLAFAIFTFDPANTATTIVQGFGVALATTIVGLVLRVYFNQTRADLVEVEDSARIELAQAAGKLRSELSQVIVSMNDYGRQTRQSLSELQNEVTQTLQEVRTESAAIMKAQADDANARSKKLLVATEKLVSGFEQSTSSFEEISKSHSAFADSLKAIQTAAASTQTTMVQLATQSLELSKAQKEIAETVHTVKDVSASVLSQVRAFDGAAEDFGKNVQEQLQTLRMAPDHIVDSAVSGIETSINRLADTITALASAQEAASRDALESTIRHNEALGNELEKSRALVSKVHSSLADMTGKIANTVETKLT